MTRSAVIWFVGAVVVGAAAAVMHILRSDLGGAHQGQALAIGAWGATGLAALMIYRGIVVAAREQDVESAPAMTPERLWQLVDEPQSSGYEDDVVADYPERYEGYDPGYDDGSGRQPGHGDGAGYAAGYGQNPGQRSAEGWGPNLGPNVGPNLGQGYAQHPGQGYGQNPGYDPRYGQHPGYDPRYGQGQSSGRGPGYAPEAADGDARDHPDESGREPVEEPPAYTFRAGEVGPGRRGRKRR